MKRIVSLFIVIGVTALALSYALWDVNYDELGKLLSQGNYRTMVPIFGLIFIFYWLKAIRWRLILQPLGKFSLSQVTPPMMIGFAGSNILPGHLGEFIRTGVFSRRYSCPVSGVFITIVVERIFDIIAILGLYEIGILMIDKPPESLQIGAWFIAPVLVGILSVIMLLLWKPTRILSLWELVGKCFASNFQKSVHGLIENVITAFSSLKSPLRVLALLFLSFMKWLLVGGIVWFSLDTFGHPITLQLTFVVLGILTLAATAPSAPGCIGAIQAAFVFALKPFGISEEIAFASSVLFLMSQWIPVTAVGAYYFISSGLQVADVRNKVTEVEETSLG